MAVSGLPRSQRRGLARGWRWFLGIVILLVVVGGAGWILWNLTPWPSALAMRSAFDRDARIKAEALEKYVPEGVEPILNIRYLERDRGALLDVFSPSDSAHGGSALPTVVWVHGGAWVGGDKDHVANYLKIIAAEGYTVVGLNYSLAPAAHYPEPVQQVHVAMAWLVDNAERMHVDPSRFVLAGDSAGAQIAAQVVATTVDPDYAALVGVVPALDPEQIRGVVLNAGVFDVTLAKQVGEPGAPLYPALWAYFGRRDFQISAAFQSAGVIEFVDENFPPTYISAGNADPLLADSEHLAAKLTELGVPVNSLFWPADHQPPLQHEYEFVLDNDEGQEALARTLAFIESVMQ